MKREEHQDEIQSRGEGGTQRSQVLPDIHVVPLADEVFAGLTTTSRPTWRRSDLAEVLDVSPTVIRTLHQVHGTTIVDADNDDLFRNGAEPEGDALITERDDVTLAVKVADCAGVLIYDTVTRRRAAIHSGWRGSAAGIVTLVLDGLFQRGSLAENLRVSLVPSASAERYPVREDVARFFPRCILPNTAVKDSWLFDNKAVLEDQLLRAGIRHTHLFIDPACTIADKSFHSWRRDGERAGRGLAFLTVRPYRRDENP